MKNLLQNKNYTTHINIYTLYTNIYKVIPFLILTYLISNSTKILQIFINLYTYYKYNNSTYSRYIISIKFISNSTNQIILSQTNNYI